MAINLYFNFSGNTEEYIVSDQWDTTYPANSDDVIMWDDGYGNSTDLIITFALGIEVESIVIIGSYPNSFTEISPTVWILEQPPYNNWPPDGSEYDVIVTVAGEGVEEISSPFNKLWLVDFETMKSLSEISEYDVTNTEVNLSSFIIKILSLPFEIPDEFIFDGGEQPIQIGSNPQTAVTAPAIISDLITYDLGVVKVLGVYGNSLDHTNKTFTLVLPMVEETIDLDGSEVIGIELKINLIVDAYNGDTTINLFKDDDEMPFKSVKTAIGRSLPFRISDEISPNDLSGNYGYYNGTLTAYVRVSENELFESEFNNLISVNENIGSNKGYIKVNEINLLCNSTSEEKEMIISQLKEGVMINE